MINSDPNEALGVEPAAHVEGTGAQTASCTPHTVPPAERQLSVWCGPHTKRGRYRIAVVTTSGQVVTNDGVWDLSRPTGPITAPCPRCIAPLHPYEAPRLDHRRLQAMVVKGVRETLLREVVVNPPATTVARSAPPP